MFSKKNLLLYLIFLLGIVLQLTVIFPSGIRTKNGMYFWSSHGHDGTWHIAVANELQKNFPPKNPVFTGENLYNYHFISDVPIATLNYIFGIPKEILYFQITPIIYSIFLGIAAYLAGKELSDSKIVGAFSAFAVYFVGSFGYVVTLLKYGKIGGESLFWSSQTQSTIGNPPQIISNIFFFFTIYYLIKFIKSKNNKNAALLTLTSSFTILSKIYAAFVILPAFGFLFLYQVIAKKDYSIFKVILSVLIISFLAYFPFTKSAESFLVFEPFWYTRRLLSNPSRIGLKNFEFVIQHYQSLSSIKSKFGFARYDLLGLLLIFIGNLGIRIIGIFSIPSVLEKKRIHVGIFLLSAAFFSFTFPNLFLQKGVATNTSQTFSYMLLVFSLLFALQMEKILYYAKTNITKFILIIFMFTLSIPTQAALIYQFYSKSANAYISSKELEALDYIKKNTDKNTVILTPAYDKYLETGEVPPPIWDWFDTSYVAAFSERKVFMSDYEQMDIMGYKIQERRNFQNEIFINSEIKKEKLLKRNIDYIYFPKHLTPNSNLKNMGFVRVFENDKAEVWKVN